MELFYILFLSIIIQLLLIATLKKIFNIKIYKFLLTVMLINSNGNTFFAIAEKLFNMQLLEGFSGNVFALLAASTTLFILHMIGYFFILDRVKVCQEGVDELNKLLKQDNTNNIENQ